MTRKSLSQLIIAANGFWQIVKEPTRVTDTSSSLINLVFTNCPVNMTHTFVIISSLSKYNIRTVRKINHLKYPSRAIKSRNYAKYDHQKFCNDVSEIDWSLVFCSNNVNVAFSHFNSKLQEAVDTHAPFIKKEVKGRECKWLNAEIKSEMNSRNQLYRKAQKSRKEKDWTIYKKQHIKFNNLIKKAKVSYHRNLIEDSATNSKKFLSCIKAVLPSKTCSIQTCTSISLSCTVKTFVIILV